MFSYFSVIQLASICLFLGLSQQVKQQNSQVALFLGAFLPLSHPYPLILLIICVSPYVDNFWSVKGVLEVVQGKLSQKS